jgi:uncharacterized protein (DUF433 family)
MGNYDVELMDQSMYSAAMAGRLTGLHAARVRRWIQGYHFKYIQRKNGTPVEINMGPVISREGRTDCSVSFLELIDLLYVKKLLDVGFSLQKIRRLLNEACSLIRGANFLRKCFYFDGKEIYLKEDLTEECSFTRLDSGGQLAFWQIVEQTSVAIDFDQKTHLAIKWYPTDDRLVVLDPMISFGAPTIVGRGLRTSNIYDFYVAERNNITATCDWLELKESEAKSAISFEESLLAA